MERNYTKLKKYPHPDGAVDHVEKVPHNCTEVYPELLQDTLSQTLFSIVKFPNTYFNETSNRKLHK